MCLRQKITRRVLAPVRKIASPASKPLAAITRPAMSSVLSSSPAAVRSTPRQSRDSSLRRRSDCGSPLTLGQADALVIIKALKAARLRPGQRQPHIVDMHLDLSDEEAAALTQELHDIVENDRYPFSPRIRTLRGILAKLRPEPVREPLPPPKVYAPPSKGRHKRRGSRE